MIENWRPIRAFEGLYEVSDLGRVRSLDRTVLVAGGGKRNLKGVVLRPGIGTTGYYLVSLARGGHTYTRKVHRLVAVAFVNGIADGLEVCHNDGNPLNNRADNLRWGTSSSNSLDTIRHGKWSNQNVGKAECIHGHRLAGDNLYIRPNGNRACRQCRRDCKRRYRRKKI